MGLSEIIILVLIAMIILGVSFTFFKILITLIPVALIAILVLWVVYLFSKRKNSKQSLFIKRDWSKTNVRPHKKARNVTTKDIDEDK